MEVKESKEFTCPSKSKIIASFKGASLRQLYKDGFVKEGYYFILYTKEGFTVGFSPGTVIPSLENILNHFLGDDREENADITVCACYESEWGEFPKEVWDEINR